jgi:hypothetical protein
MAIPLSKATTDQILRAIAKVEDALAVASRREEHSLLAKLDVYERELERREARRGIRANPTWDQAKRFTIEQMKAGPRRMVRSTTLPIELAYNHPELLALLGPKGVAAGAVISGVKAARKNRGKKKRAPRTEAQFRAALAEIEPRRGTEFALRVKRKAGAHKDKTKYARRRKHHSSED